MASDKVVAFRSASRDSSEVLCYRSLDQVTPRSVSYLDRPFWQRGAFHLVAGKKGAAKGTYLAHLAAKVTTGRLYEEPKNVMWLGSEDSDAIDIHPRVTAAGGDHRRIFTFTEAVTFPRDIQRLHETARDIGDVGLLAVDPIGNHMGGVKTNDEGAVRKAIAPLNDLADDLDLVLYGVRHLGKDTSRGGLDSILGSTAWRDVPRCVVVFAEDDEDDLTFHMEVVAGNRGPKGEARMFRVDLVSLPGLEEPITRAVELGASTKCVDDLLEVVRDRTKVPKAKLEKLVLEQLADGPKSRQALNDAAAPLGISGDVLYRNALVPLRERAEIRCYQERSGWYWRTVRESVEAA